MKSICFSFATVTVTGSNPHNLRRRFQTRNPPSSIQTPNYFPVKRTQRSFIVLRSQSSSEPRENQQGQDPESLVQDLRVPDHWLLPSNALEVPIIEISLLLNWNYLFLFHSLESFNFLINLQFSLPD